MIRAIFIEIMKGKDMENIDIGLSPKESIDLMAEKQKGDLKIILLEKHLMAQREMYNKLKEEENESLRKQEAVITEMYKITSDIKKYNEMAEETVKVQTQRIKDELFDAWQSSIKQVLDEEIARAVEKSFSETSAVIERQNNIIETQSKNIKSLITGYRIMKFMSYAIMTVAIIVLAILPLGQFGYIKLEHFFDEPSWWGGVIMFAAIIMLVLSIVLVSKIKSRLKSK